MPLAKAMPLGNLQAGTIAEYDFNDASYALCNVDGIIYCIDGTCPHASGPLAQGALHGSTVVCPWHGWEFDVRTGACEDDATCRLTTYPALVKEGQIFVQLP